MGRFSLHLFSTCICTYRLCKVQKGKTNTDLHLTKVAGRCKQVQAAPPVSAPAGFPGGGSHNDQAGETRGLEGGTKPVKGLSASERVVATS